MNRETHRMLSTLESLGFSPSDALALRRISMTLHAWHELECGTEYGYLTQDETTGKWTMHGVNGGQWQAPDRERGAKKRLGKIMAKHPTLRAYIQGDPRGASLYILRPGDVPAGENADAYYSRGVAVFK